MKLIALCGAAGAGKDTVADALPARKLAFADALYREVAEAWGVDTAHSRILRCGSSAARGGAVSGLGGHNAAMAALALLPGG